MNEHRFTARRGRGRARFIVSLAALCCLPSLACEETTEPPVVPAIAQVSGDGQYSKKGTPVLDPLVVRVTLSDGTAAQGYTVRFQVVTGGGSVATPSAVADDAGRASTGWTLGPNAGENSVRASLESATNLGVDFVATGGEFFCPEEDPTFVRKHGLAGHLFLFTRRSSLHMANGDFAAGVVKLAPDFVAGVATATRLRKLDDQGSITVVARDCAFSAAGDFFVALGDIDDFITKIAPNGALSTLSSLEDPFGAEITYSPTGILIGCDSFGPFIVTCRDPLGRFAEATYAGTPQDRAHNDAVAVDPVTEDIYFIHLPDFQLLRLPVDSLAAVGPTEMVTQLTRWEAEGARGMVVNDDDQNLFILVDSDTTKAILRVTPGGTKTVEYDFFDRGSGASAGVQNDLALSPVGGGRLYTIDTLNDMLLAFDLTQQILVELPPQSSDPEAISAADGLGGERVGLIVLP
ncbi:MAG: hypothetical protein OEO21_02760 [Candidatus Krumholzibacteria bacterium]|nr:hypothetical protein [Candidatus Krumholzibacteria bacterium]